VISFYELYNFFEKILYFLPKCLAQNEDGQHKTPFTHDEQNGVDENDIFYVFHVKWQRNHDAPQQTRNYKKKVADGFHFVLFHV
jgi:hypothetical protein